MSFLPLPRSSGRALDEGGQLARTNNTLIVPSNVSDIAGLVASAMTVLEGARKGETVKAA